MKPIEAVRVLQKNGNTREAVRLLYGIWSRGDFSPNEEFPLLASLVELLAIAEPTDAETFLEKITSGHERYQGFWLRRSMAEHAQMLDWHGRMAFARADYPKALDSLGRAASLGRDTTLIWRQLGFIYADLGDLDLSIRYLRRSLSLFRQMDLKLLSGGEEVLGTFCGTNPLSASHGAEEYLSALLAITKLAKNQKRLKAVRELVVEMIHHFPEEDRLTRVRHMFETAIVNASVPETRPTPTARLAELTR